MPPLPQMMMPPIRIRYNTGNGNAKGKTMGNPKKGKIEVRILTLLLKLLLSLNHINLKKIL